MNDLLLVHTMGKVASTVVSESLIASRVECHDIHTIRKKVLKVMFFLIIILVGLLIFFDNGEL